MSKYLQKRRLYQLNLLYFDDQGSIQQKDIKDIGKEIPHLVIFNISRRVVEIKLSSDGKTWVSFTLDDISKNIYRCDAIQNLFIIIDPYSEFKKKAKITRNKKYKITFEELLGTFQILEI